MKFLKKSVLGAILFASLSTVSGCELFEPETTVDPVTGETVVVTITPRAPRERREPRGGGGSGGWGS